MVWTNSIERTPSHETVSLYENKFKWKIPLEESNKGGSSCYGCCLWDGCGVRGDEEVDQSAHGEQHKQSRSDDHSPG